MARRTNTDAIRELERNEAILTERFDNLVGRVEQIDGGVGELAMRIGSLGERLAVTEERIRQAEDRLAREESRRGQMSLLFLGAFISFLASLVVLVLNLLFD